MSEFSHMNFSYIVDRMGLSKELYYNDTLTHYIVSSIQNGQEPIKLLGQVIETHNRILKEYQDYINKCPIPPIIIKKQSDL